MLNDFVGDWLDRNLRLSLNIASILPASVSFEVSLFDEQLAGIKISREYHHAVTHEAKSQYHSKLVWTDIEKTTNWSTSRNCEARTC